MKSCQVKWNPFKPGQAGQSGSNDGARKPSIIRFIQFYSMRLYAICPWLEVLTSENETGHEIDGGRNKTTGENTVITTYARESNFKSNCLDRKDKPPNHCIISP